MKLKLIILFSVIISLTINISNIETLLNNIEIIIPIILSILALSITSYTFIISPLQKIMEKTDDKNKALIIKLMKNYKENMLFMFYGCLIILIIEIILNINFPIIKNPHNIDFGIFVIASLKKVTWLTIQDVIILLSFYSFYDIMKSTFIIVDIAINISNGK